MRLYLVRHGETEGNLVHMFQSDVDELSSKGQEQAALLAQRFAKIHVDMIISSPYSRTRATAEAIARSKKLPVTVNELLVEKKWPKELEGKPADDPSIQAIRKLLHEKEHTDPQWRYSDEERFIDVRERCVQFLTYLQTLSSDMHILVVSHAHILKVMLSVMIHGPAVSAQLFRNIFHMLSLHNTGITIAEHVDDQWHLLTVNDHAHLGDYHRQIT